MENKKHPNCLIRLSQEALRLKQEALYDINYLKEKLKRATCKQQKARIKNQIKILKDCVVIYRLVRP